jgi:hypothetical protein
MIAITTGLTPQSRPAASSSDWQRTYAFARDPASSLDDVSGGPAERESTKLQEEQGNPAQFTGPCIPMARHGFRRAA